MASQSSSFSPSSTLTTFRSYQLSLEFHSLVSSLRCAGYLRSQLLRASSSVCLNLAEGCGKDSPLDRKRSYLIALGSLREVQAVLDLTPSTPESMRSMGSQLGAYIYRLTHPRV